MEEVKIVQEIEIVHEINMSWSRLIRFESEGQIFYGEPEIEKAEDLTKLLNTGSLYAKVFVGNSAFDLSDSTSTRKQVTKLLGVLEPKDVPIIKCVGLNYIKHSKQITLKSYH